MSSINTTADLAVAASIVAATAAAAVAISAATGGGKLDTAPSSPFWDGHQEVPSITTTAPAPHSPRRSFFLDGPMAGTEKADLSFPPPFPSVAPSPPPLPYNPHPRHSLTLESPLAGISERDLDFPPHPAPNTRSSSTAFSDKVDSKFLVPRDNDLERFMMDSPF